VTTTTITSNDIAGQIAALDQHISALDREVSDLALAAVGGDKDATSRISTIRREIDRAHADLKILEAARLAAIGKEVAAADERDDADRARHLGEARLHAVAILELAGRADEAIAAFVALVADIDRTERALWGSLRAANARPSDAIVGRNGLAETALTQMEVRVRGIKVSDLRSISEIAAVAWEFLEPETESEAA
jgi:hypothetical protein